MVWSRLDRSSFAGLVLACATSCINLGPGYDDELGDGGSTSSESSGSEVDSTESTTTTTDSDTVTATADSSNSDTAATTTDSDSTDSTDTTDSTTGEPCLPAEVTEVAECPMIVGEGFCSEGGGHVDTQTIIEWGNNPPHSGKHFPIWSTAGEHLTPVERGYWVHNLEHGWVVLLHNCPEPCEADLDVLRVVIDARPEIPILMTADPLLDGPRFAAVSWTWVHEFETPVLEDLLCFVDQHYDHAPESIP